MRSRENAAVMTIRSCAVIVGKMMLKRPIRSNFDPREVIE